MITVDEVREVAERIAKGSRRKNPEENATCVYTSKKGKHCVAGEVLSQLGLPVPSNGTKDNQTGIKAIAKYWWPELDPHAVLFLDNLQRAADDRRPYWYKAWNKIQ